MNNNKEITIYDIAIKLDESPSTVSSLNNHPLVTKGTRKRVSRYDKAYGISFKFIYRKFAKAAHKYFWRYYVY